MPWGESELSRDEKTQLLLGCAIKTKWGLCSLRGCLCGAVGGFGVRMCSLMTVCPLAARL
jgi:hypothetical protein